MHDFYLEKVKFKHFKYLKFSKNLLYTNLICEVYVILF